MLHAHDMGRPKKYNYPPNMTFDTTWRHFVVRNPVTKKSRTFKVEGDAIQAVGKLNALLEVERQQKLIDDGRPRISGLVDAWLRDRLQFKPWDVGTRQNNVAKMNRIKKELGERPVARTDSMFLEDWIAARAPKPDAFNDWRYVLVLLWTYAVSRHLCESNEAEKVLKRSTSLKLDINRKERQALTIQGYKTIYGHEKCPGFLKVAMDDSLVTLQGRSEVCNMQHTHFRDGYLYVIRDKVSGDSDMAFIRIKVTEQIEEIRLRAAKLDGTVSPYLVHRQPDYLRRDWTEGKPHWTYVNPDYLTKAFAEVRDATGLWAHLKPRQRPTFHEVRGLGARLLEAQGVSREAIRALMTHTHVKTTRIYLEGGIKALSDDDFQVVSAPLVLKEALR